MTDHEIEAAIIKGEGIFTGHRLDNGELITGPIDLHPETEQVWIDGVLCDTTKPFHQIFLTDEDA